MSLIQCPECNHDVSDKAVSCPNCGYPMNSPTSIKPRIKNGKPSKLPNGDGCIYRLSGKRRKPYAVRKTAGWIIDPDTGKSKQTYINLGTYATRSEAMQALSVYNADPYDLSASTITFEEIYSKWSEEHFKTIVPSAQRVWKSAFSYCEPIHKMHMKDIKVNHLEQTIKNAQVGDSIKVRMKSLFNQMFRYAMKYEIVDKNYALLCDGIKKPKPEIVRIPFSDAEIQKLWDNIQIPFTDMVLIGIYTGFRPTELCVLQIDNIDLDQQIIIGGLKTDAGKNRIVPIHPRIGELIQKNHNHAKEMHSDYLFNDDNCKQVASLSYDQYRERFNRVMNQLDMVHKPHDTRHAFITKAKKANMNEYILKMIVGHVVPDITESTYTHRTVDDLHREIQKIK